MVIFILLILFPLFDRWESWSWWAYEDWIMGISRNFIISNHWKGLCKGRWIWTCKSKMMYECLIYAFLEDQDWFRKHSEFFKCKVRTRFSLMLISLPRKPKQQDLMGCTFETFKWIFKSYAHSNFLIYKTCTSNKITCYIHAALHLKHLSDHSL